jgi:hypothetical protein
MQCRKTQAEDQNAFYYSEHDEKGTGKWDNCTYKNNDNKGQTFPECKIFRASLNRWPPSNQSAVSNRYWNFVRQLISFA